MQCVILFRNPSNRSVGFVSDGEDIAVFRSHDEAQEKAADVPILKAFPYQIVELDEL